MTPTGRWIITLDTPLGPKSGVLELLVEGEVVTGSMSDGEHHVAIEAGRVVGDRLTWSAKLTKPMRMNIKFTAIVESNRLSGEAKHLLGRATFSGVRAA